MSLFTLFRISTGDAWGEIMFSAGLTLKPYRSLLKMPDPERLAPILNYFSFLLLSLSWPHSSGGLRIGIITSLVRALSFERRVDCGTTKGSFSRDSSKV